MRIARYELDGAVALGVVEGAGDSEVVRSFADGADVLSLLQETPDQRAAHPLGEPSPLSAVKLLTPLQPPSVRDFVSFARSKIAAYAIFNDWSARDLQGEDRALGMGWAKGKDTASTLGPWLVTADELEPYRDGEGRLDLKLTVWLTAEHIGTIENRIVAGSAPADYGSPRRLPA